MKKSLILSVFAAILGYSTSFAQVPMPLPNGSFEQWSSHQGYGVQVLIINVPVYSAFSTPSGWDYLSYPVNETFSMMGMSLNINTSIPVVLASPETGSVPDSNTALKLQTLMISDIVSSTVLNLAGSSIDPTLLQQVIPSILSTGAVDIDAVLPIISDVMSGTGDIMSMVPTLLAMDVNDIISGGLSLNGIRPGRLTGSYKYHSAIGGDNGAVIMLGTRYNTSSHQRSIVGLGLNLSLTDTSEYTPFEVEYMPLSAFLPGAQDGTPDSLIVAIVSSASTNMQQGSYLCVDNLMLWPAPDTCADITSADVTAGIHEAMLEWSVADATDRFEIEYGPTGFELGSGTLTTTSGNSLLIDGLVPNSAYDVYLHSLCNDSIYGRWFSLQFATLPDTCASVLNLRIEDLVFDAFPQMALVWRGSSQPDHWEVEYGPQGFEPGTGTRVETILFDFNIFPLEDDGTLLPNSWYDFYVRSVCSDSVYGEWDSVHYLSHCAEVKAVTIDGDESHLTATTNNRISGYRVNWTDTTGTQNWNVYYGIYNPQLPDNWGTLTTVDAPHFEFPPLQPSTTYRVEISSQCGEDNIGKTVSLNFTTIALPDNESVDLSETGFDIIVSPNPAHGMCLVNVTNNLPAELKLFNLEGKLLQTANCGGSPATMRLPAKGIYILQATTAKGVVKRKVISE